MLEGMFKILYDSVCVFYFTMFSSDYPSQEVLRWEDIFVDTDLYLEPESSQLKWHFVTKLGASWG